MTSRTEVLVVHGRNAQLHRVRFAFPPLFALTCCTLLRADRAAEIATIHAEAMGGRARIEALVAIRATGHVNMTGKRVPFVLLAARPNKYRFETPEGVRTWVQLANPANPAPPHAELNAKAGAPGLHELAPVLAPLMTGALFDNPLLAAATGDTELEYAGELNVGGTRRLRIIATGKEISPSHLILDGHSYLLLNRVEERRRVGGGLFALTTSYEDFRPVAGVLLPHKIATSSEGRVLHVTLFAHIEPNPEVAPGAFDELPVLAARLKEE